MAPSGIEKKTIGYARALRKNMTEGEKRLWRELRNWKREFGLHVRKQSPVGKYIADFLINERKLVIEIDGEHHFSDQGMKRDSVRDACLRSQGYTIIRFDTGAIDETFEGCVEVIMREAGLC